MIKTLELNGLTTSYLKDKFKETNNLIYYHTAMALFWEDYKPEDNGIYNQLKSIKKGVALKYFTDIAMKILYNQFEEDFNNVGGGINTPQDYYEPYFQVTTYKDITSLKMANDPIKVKEEEKEFEDITYKVFDEVFGEVEEETYDSPYDIFSRLFWKYSFYAKELEIESNQPAILSRDEIKDLLNAPDINN